MLILAGVAFLSIASITWFFASRPRMFVRMFGGSAIPRTQLRQILKGSDFGKGMRYIGLLQAVVGLVFLVVGLMYHWP